VPVESNIITVKQYNETYNENVKSQLGGCLYVLWILLLLLLFLQVYNGTENSTEVARLCGSTIPNPIFLNTSSARLVFVTDSSVTHRGYDITYTSSPLGGWSSWQTFTLCASFHNAAKHRPPSLCGATLTQPEPSVIEMNTEYLKLFWKWMELNK